MILAAYPLTCLKIAPRQRNKKVYAFQLKWQVFPVNSIAICLHCQHLPNIEPLLPPAFPISLPLAASAHVISETIV